MHEQTDRALSDAQSQLIQSEADLNEVMDKLKQTDRVKSDADNEVIMLRNDVKIMKSQLAKIDQEKDELLVININKKKKTYYIYYT